MKQRQKQSLENRAFLHMYHKALHHAMGDSRTNWMLARTRRRRHSILRVALRGKALKPLIHNGRKPK